MTKVLNVNFQILNLYQKPESTGFEIYKLGFKTKYHTKVTSDYKYLYYQR